jgi:group I intron endonuclease
MKLEYRHSGIYQILNTVTGKCYIGSAVSIKKRLSHHLIRLNSGSHHNKKIQNAWNKYGAEIFVFEPILICDKSLLLFYEQLVIDAFDSVDSGYNLRPNAENNLGYKMSQEAIAKTVAALKGRVFSESHRAKIAVARKGTKSSPETIAKLRQKKMSEEAKAKVSAFNKGIKRSSETKLKMSAAQIGRVQSEEARKKISEKLSGRVLPDEVKEKIAKKLTGRKMRPEDVEKAAASHRGKKRSAEACANIKKGWEARKARLLLNPDMMKHSEETKAKMSASRKSLYAKRKAASN